MPQVQRVVKATGIHLGHWGPSLRCTRNTEMQKGHRVPQSTLWFTRDTKMCQGTHVPLGTLRCSGDAGVLRQHLDPPGTSVFSRDTGINKGHDNSQGTLGFIRDTGILQKQILRDIRIIQGHHAVRDAESSRDSLIHQRHWGPLGTLECSRDAWITRYTKGHKGHWRPPGNLGITGITLVLQGHLGIPGRRGPNN